MTHVLTRTISLLALSLIVATCSQTTENDNKGQEEKTGDLQAESTQELVNEQFRVMFYNVENLFDVINDPDTEDDAFTPGGEKQWTRERFEKKINDIARVVSEIGNGQLPAVIGLCEVENIQVLKALIGSEPLSGGQYGIVHFDSYDQRGIDVALLYRSDLVKVKQAELFPVKSESLENLLTRDILYVNTNIGGEAFHFFVNHWKSRYGGVEETEPMRVAAAKVVRAKIDQIQEGNPKAKIVVMGDFNDNPENHSLSKTLNALAENEIDSPDDMFNPVKGKDAESCGSYNYKGEWEMFNQIIVSQNTLAKEGVNGYCLDTENMGAYKADWMLYEKEDGTRVPNRTYGGPNYYGGISDHLPVYAGFAMTR